MPHPQRIVPQTYLYQKMPPCQHSIVHSAGVEGALIREASVPHRVYLLTDGGKIKQRFLRPRKFRYMKWCSKCHEVKDFS